MRTRIAVAVFAVLAAFAGRAAAEDIYLYGPHAGIERVDAKAFETYDLTSPDKALVAHGITFNITYEDPANTGFNSNTQGAERKARLEDALTYAADVINETGTLDVVVKPSQNVNNNLLATGSTFFSASAGLQNGSAFSRLANGVKPFAGLPEIQITVNFFHSFHTGTGPAPVDRRDFLSVLIHEVTHAIGFVSVMNSTGGSVIAANVYSGLDSFLRRNTSGINMVAGNPPAFAGAAADLISNDIGFDGTEAFAAFGDFAPIESDSPFVQGTNLSHFDSSIDGGAIMEPSFGPGETKRIYAPVEVGALIDLGYANAEEPGNTPGPCALTAVNILNPAAGNINLNVGETQRNISFNATVTFAATPGCTENAVTVSYRLNGGAPFTSTNRAANFPQGQLLGPGSYTLNVTATTTGVAGSVSASRNFTIVANTPTPNLSVSPASAVSFGEVEDGASGVTDFTVTNTGGGTLTGQANVTGAAFSIVSGSPYNVAAGANALVRVRFTPSGTGNFTGSITFTGTGGPLTRNLSGTGIKAGAACGCGPADAPRSPYGDALVALLAAAALLWHTRRRAC